MHANKEIRVKCTAASAQRVVDKVLYANKRWDVDLRAVASFEELPESAKASVRSQYGNESKYAKGVFHGESVYIIAENHADEADIEGTIVHEVCGHLGIRRFYGKEITEKLNNLYTRIGGLRGLSAIAASRGISLELSDYALAMNGSSLSDESRIRVVMDEALALLAERPRFGDSVKELVGGIRSWLRDHGIMRLASLGVTDLLHTIRVANSCLDKKPLPHNQKHVYGSPTGIAYVGNIQQTYQNTGI